MTATDQLSESPDRRTLWYQITYIRRRLVEGTVEPLERPLWFARMKELHLAWRSASASPGRRVEPPERGRVVGLRGDSRAA